VRNGKILLPLTWKVYGVMYHYSDVRVGDNMIKSAGMYTVVVSIQKELGINRLPISPTRGSSRDRKKKKTKLKKKDTRGGLPWKISVPIRYVYCSDFRF